ncbi:hypothetical protein BOX15_Mlig021423g3 [Macrostomum lignano]|uniref:Alpha-1,3-mannosyl-glycoprotein 2-beta-N-acetylglucosaminyltransferase n=1 Tax=Macrostomum lignano TaxID=282301 RepID=A0A267FTL8_9PLAT|nr:hypothetical protein BOX15_Mlig021423g3 [Macrostomum lignano]
MLDCLRRGGRLCATRRQRVFILAFLLALGLLHPFVTLDNHIKKTPEKQKPEISTDSTGFRTTWSYNVTLSNSAVRLHQMSSTNSSVRAPDAKQNKEIALVVLAATRPEVHQLVRQLVAQKPDSGFRIMISLDGTEKQTNEVLQQIETPEVKLLRLSDDKSHKFKPSSDTYVKIARHYLRVLDHLILKLNYSYVVLMEDDLLIAPDFYQYFSSLRRALDSDESIFCVSAWNDNGQIGLVTEDPQLLHRTDFFPGLGWMINRRHWLQVRKVWPKTQYDDFLRLYMLNNRLVCVRPELSRTFNIGRNGGRVLSGKTGTARRSITTI